MKLLQTIRKSRIILSIVIAGAMLVVPVTSHALIDSSSSKTEACKGVTLSDSTASCNPNAGATANVIIGRIINILSIVAGVVAVIMIIIGGLKYITSQGEASNVQSAKNTILYAIVGLIIAALAQVIVRFVLLKVK